MERGTCIGKERVGLVNFIIFDAPQVELFVSKYNICFEKGALATNVTLAVLLRYYRSSAWKDQQVAYN